MTFTANRCCVGPHETAACMLHQNNYNTFTRVAILAGLQTVQYKDTILCVVVKCSQNRPSYMSC